MNNLYSISTFALPDNQITMNYYLVSYLVYESGQVLKPSKISLKVAGLGDIETFKEQIAEKLGPVEKTSIIIQSYNQLTQSEFFSHLNTRN